MHSISNSICRSTSTPLKCRRSVLCMRGSRWCLLVLCLILMIYPAFTVKITSIPVMHDRHKSITSRKSILSSRRDQVPLAGGRYPSTKYTSLTKKKKKHLRSDHPKKDNVPILSTPFSRSWWWYHVRVGLAGGIAGAVGTTLLYPIDSAKTLRQANPEQFKSVWVAFLSSKSNWYRGVVPAALGAIPASALYFGAYESMKSLLLQLQVKHQRNKNTTVTTKATVSSRLILHACAAASGNILSSAVFVPKEFIKQQLQYGSSKSIRHCIAQYGLRGLYRGYQATLLRNIPSAALRFVLYEELKYALYTSQDQDSVGSWRLFVAGAASGALASGLLTPMDVLKTRMSVGQCPVDLPGCFHHVLDTAGWTAFYAGAGSRMLFSGMFSAAGFGTFETVKRWLNVSSRNVQE